MHIINLINLFVCLVSTLFRPIVFLATYFFINCNIFNLVSYSMTIRIFPKIVYGISNNVTGFTKRWQFFIINVNQHAYHLRSKWMWSLSSCNMSIRPKLERNIPTFFSWLFHQEIMGCQYLKQFWKWSLASYIPKSNWRYKSIIESICFLPNMDWNHSSKRKQKEDPISNSIFQLFKYFANHWEKQKRTYKILSQRETTFHEPIGLHIGVSLLDMVTLPWMLFLQLDKHN